MVTIATGTATDKLPSKVRAEGDGKIGCAGTVDAYVRGLS